jgi:glycosyltransferase involved in cell wall biosynthesis
MNENNNKNFENILFIKDPLAEGGLRTKSVFKENIKNKPLISIITVVLNGEKHLEESIKSLHNQLDSNYEHIIIDGGSTDKTLDIIKKFEDKIEYWCQINDNGIYDAFNLGMQLSKGEYIGFLNSDDQYTPEAFKYLNSYIRKYPEKDFIFGSVRKHWGILYGYRPYKIYWSWGFYSSHSTGFFIKLNSAKKVGFYNLKYKYSADYDFFFRMIVKEKLKGIGTKKEELFGIFRRGGFSSRIKFIDHFFEEINIRIDNGQNKLLILIIFIYKFLKNFSKISN